MTLDNTSLSRRGQELEPKIPTLYFVIHNCLEYRMEHSSPYIRSDNSNSQIGGLRVYDYSVALLILQRSATYPIAVANRLQASSASLWTSDRREAAVADSPSRRVLGPTSPGRAGPGSLARYSERSSQSFGRE